MKSVLGDSDNPIFNWSRNAMPTRVKTSSHSQSLVHENYYFVPSNIVKSKLGPFLIQTLVNKESQLMPPSRILRMKSSTIRIAHCR